MNQREKDVVRAEVRDLEESRDAQWASGDRYFAERNDARATVLREVLDGKIGPE